MSDIASYSPRILVFAGSARAHSYNRRLANAAAHAVNDCGGRASLLELNSLGLPLFNEDEEARSLPLGIFILKQTLLEHDGWIICSPEYNGGYPPLLKNALDWASRPILNDAQWGNGLTPFAGKVVGVMAASSGGLGGMRALAQLRPILSNLKCWVAPNDFALGYADTAFNEHQQLINPAQNDAMKAVVAQVVWASKRLRA